MKKNRKGFTLVEIMIVVAIIGILAAIAIPNFLLSRKKSHMNACIANLKQIQGAKEQSLLAGQALQPLTCSELESTSRSSRAARPSPPSRTLSAKRIRTRPVATLLIRAMNTRSRNQPPLRRLHNEGA